MALSISCVAPFLAVVTLILLTPKVTEMHVHGGLWLGTEWEEEGAFGPSPSQNTTGGHSASL